MKPYYADDAVTLYLGDCREVLPSLRGCSDPAFQVQPSWFAGAVVTDVPYNCRINYGELTDDNMPWPEWCEWMDLAVAEMKRCAPNVFSFLSQTAYRKYLKHGQYEPDWALTWVKPLSMAICAAPFMPHYEPIAYWGVQKRTRDGGALWGSDVLTANVEVGTDRWGHPTAKPLTLMLEMVSKFTGTILDPFAGSGTTLEAAKHLGRKAIGIEINEQFCERIATRLLRTTPGLRAAMSQDGLFAHEETQADGAA